MFREGEEEEIKTEKRFVEEEGYVGDGCIVRDEDVFEEEGPSCSAAEIPLGDATALEPSNSTNRSATFAHHCRYDRSHTRSAHTFTTNPTDDVHMSSQLLLSTLANPLSSPSLHNFCHRRDIDPVTAHHHQDS